MIIKKINLHNIRSYLDQSIELPSGFVLLSGDIGSGKSTVLLATEFALFGLERGIVDGASLLRNGKDEGYVEIEFEIAGHSIIIKRTLKRSGGAKTVAQSSASIVIDGAGKELTATELKSFVLNILNYSASLLRKRNLIYRYTVYCPQEEMKKIILESADIRLDTLRKVFDIDKYERILSNCEIFVSQLKDRRKEKEGQIVDLHAKKSRLNEKKSFIEEIGKKTESLNSSLAKTQNELAELKSKLREEQENAERLARARAKIASIDATLREKKIHLKQLEDEECELSKTIENLKAELLNHNPVEEKELKEKIQKIEEEILEKRESEKIIDRELAALASKKDGLLSDFKKIGVLKICPVCQQVVTDEHRKKIASEIEQELKNIDEKSDKNEIILNGLRSELKNREQQLKEYVEKEKKASFNSFKISSLKEKEERKVKILELISQIRLNVEEIESARKSEMVLVENYKNFEQRRSATEQEFDEKQKHERALLIEKTALEQSFKDSSIELAELQKEIEQKERIALALSKIGETQEFLANNFSAVVRLMEKQVMLKLNSEFNLLFRKWFASLVDDTGLEASVDIDFSPVIMQGGYEINYNYLSGGERTALALAYRMALNQVLNSILSKINTKDIVILDEPTDGFSSEQLDKMRDVLQQLRAKQLILVSHEEKIESFVEHVISFVKEGNISKIEYI